MATSLIYKEDKRLPLIWQLLTAVLSEKNLEFTVAAVINNVLHAICRDTLLISIPLNTIPEEDIYIDLTCYKPNNSKSDEPNTNMTYKVITDYNILSTIQRYYNDYCVNVDNYKLIYRGDNMEKADEFQDYLRIKSSQGVRFFTNTDPNSFFTIPLFTGFPKIAKADQLNLLVRQLDPRYQLIEMQLFKKKINRCVDMKIRVLDMSYGNSYL